MADALVLNTGGSFSSDEFTATAFDVVDGQTYMGADTNDDIGTGNLPIIAATTNALSIVMDSSSAYMRMARGSYLTNSSYGYPVLDTPLSSVASAGNLTAAKLLAGQSACGLTGTATNDANATADKIVEGFSGYAVGIKRTGTLVISSVLPF